MSDQTVSFQTLNITTNGPIGRLTLNRPNRLNALSAQVLDELAQAAPWFDRQTNVKVVVIQGAGRAFSAGADLKAPVIDPARKMDWAARRDQAQLGLRMTTSIGQMKAVTIARVHGYAIGGAFLLMMACDFRIAAEGTLFSIPEIDLGIPLSWGGIPKLVAEIGPAMTRDLVMTCRRFDAAEAKSIGILNRVVPLEELDAHCQELAETLAAKPVVPLIMTKEQINAALQSRSSGYVAAAEGDMLLSVLQDPESLKAAQDYLEKNLKDRN